jgi:hypothetical protein
MQEVCFIYEEDGIEDEPAICINYLVHLDRETRGWD